MAQDETVIDKLTAVPTAMGLAMRLAVKHLERASIDPVIAAARPIPEPAPVRGRPDGKAL